MPPEIVPILIIFIVVGIPVICLTVLKLANIIMGNDGQQKGKIKGKLRWEQQEEETKMIQEMYQSLTQLESRIGSLETIVLQNERKR